MGLWSYRLYMKMLLLAGLDSCVRDRPRDCEVKLVLASAVYVN